MTARREKGSEKGQGIGSSPPDAHCRGFLRQRCRRNRQARRFLRHRCTFGPPCVPLFGAPLPLEAPCMPLFGAPLPLWSAIHDAFFAIVGARSATRAAFCGSDGIRHRQARRLKWQRRHFQRHRCRFVRHRCPRMGHVDPSSERERYSDPLFHRTLGIVSTDRTKLEMDVARIARITAVPRILDAVMLMTGMRFAAVGAGDRSVVGRMRGPG